jgi:hypothetical protein
LSQRCLRGGPCLHTGEGGGDGAPCEFVCLDLVPCNQIWRKALLITRVPERPSDQMPEPSVRLRRELAQETIES